ncbi:hypothetical protein MHBO_002951, partial [Bonamia ostreae]
PGRIHFSLFNFANDPKGGQIHLTVRSERVEYSYNIKIRYTKQSVKACAEQNKWFDRFTGECRDCDETGVFCPGVGISVPRLGFWAPDENAIPVVCPNRFACSETDYLLTESFDTECNDAGVRNGYLCDNCGAGTYRDIFVCKDCVGGKKSSGEVVPLAVSIVFYSVVAVCSVISVKIKATIFIAFVIVSQLSLIFRTLLSFKNIPFLSFLDILNFNISYLRQFCSNNSLFNLVSAFWLQTAFLVSVMAIFCIPMAIKWLIYKNRLSLKLVPSILNGLFFANVLIYKSVASMSVKIVGCARFPWGAEPDDLTERFCPDGGYFFSMAMGIMLMLAHTVGLPCFVAWRMQKMTAKNGEENKFFSGMFGFLVYFLRPQLTLFVLFIFGMDIFLAIDPVLYGSLGIYGAVVTIPFGAFLLLVTFLWPFKSDLFNLASIGIYTLMIAIIVLLLFVSKNDFHLYRDSSSLATIVTFVLCGITALMVLIVAFKFYNSYKRNKNDIEQE